MSSPEERAEAAAKRKAYAEADGGPDALNNGGMEQRGWSDVSDFANNPYVHDAAIAAATKTYIEVKKKIVDRPKGQDEESPEQE